MKNICHIISGDLWAGAEAQFYSSLKKLALKKEFKNYVVLLNHGDLEKKISELNIEYKVISESKSIIFIIRTLYYYLSVNKIDIIHVHGYKENFLAGILSKIFSVKLIIRTIHGKGVLEGNYKHQMIEKINKSLFTDIYIAVSDDTSKLLTRKKYNKNKIHIILNSLDVDKLIPVKSKNEIINELGIDRNNIIIGTLGRTVPVKDHFTLIEGAKLLLNEMNNIVFVIVGSGEILQELKEKVSQYELDDKIIFTGYRSDPVEMLNIFDIFVLTSLHEGIPMVILEAMYLNKPIISTSVGGIPEVLSDNYSALLFPPKTPKIFSEKCKRIIFDDNLKRKITINAKKTLNEHHLIDNAVNKLVEIYNEC